ncbi:MAG: putative metal-binding motif-containing protein [Myxococcota bacterium]
MSVLAMLCAMAFGGPVVTSDLGGDTNDDVADWCYKLDAIEVVDTSRLITISARVRYTAADGADGLTYVLYRETTPDDWTLVWDSGLVPTGNGGGFHDSPEVDEVLEAGHRYLAGYVFDDGNYTYYWDTLDLANPPDLGWALSVGSVWSAENTTYAVPNAINNAPVDDNAYEISLTVEILDGDGDGFEAGEDCDDEDPTTYPGAPELCDGLDNDCTGDPDDPVDHLYWYADEDGDGFGDDATEQDLCNGSAPEEGWVQVAGDCLDSDPLVYPEALEYCDARDGDCDGVVDNHLTYVDGWDDADGDGFGDPTDPRPWCEREVPDGIVVDDTDCDDANATAFPGGVEVCDGADNNCDGETDEGLGAVTYYTDADGDGAGDPAAPITWCDALPDGAAYEGNDCDDTNPARFPGNPEICDGIDDDCDGEAPGEDDADGDGAFACEDCDDADAASYPGAVEVCDGVDHDCDGVIPDRLACDPAPDEDVAIQGCGCAVGSAPSGFGLAGLLALGLVVRRRRG